MIGGVTGYRELPVEVEEMIIRKADGNPLFIEELTKGRARFSETVSACLERYPWPGNVRELRNAMERAVLLSRSELILPEHLPARVRAASCAEDDDARRSRRSLGIHAVRGPRAVPARRPRAPFPAFVQGSS